MLLSFVYPTNISVDRSSARISRQTVVFRPSQTLSKQQLPTHSVSVHSKRLTVQIFHPQTSQNQHLHDLRVTVANNTLITSLESALTYFPQITPLECALTKKWGGGLKAPCPHLYPDPETRIKEYDSGLHPQFITSFLHYVPFSFLPHMPYSDRHIDRRASS